MIPRLLLLLPFLFSCSFDTCAQAFEPGLLVRANGDTLRGEIENGFWVESPTFIRYRPTPASPAEIFKPRQLRAVSFTNGRFFRYEALPIDYAADTRLERIANRSLPDVRIDSLLAEVLVEGPATLLRVVRPGSTHYLLLRPDRATLDLSARKYMRKSENGTMTVVEGNNYRGQLSVFFKDCPVASSIAQTAAFTANGLATVAQAYNETCSPGRQPGRSWLQQAMPRRAVAWQGGVLLGTRYNRLRYPSELDGSCIDCRVRPFGGFYMEILQPGRAFAFYSELSLSTFRSRELVLSPSGTAGITDYNGWLGTARLGLRYFFLLPQEQQLLVGLGYELNTAWVPGRTNARVQVLLRPDQDVFGVPVITPNLSVGWRSQRITLSLDGQMYSGVENRFSKYLGNFVSSNFAVRLSAGYRLGRNPDVTKPKAPVRP
ncbi:hypothetical protein BEN47_09790 [Hymenobacter lapidarius]|uniref:Outer membrane protein beta-barrel domain-containing protein n=1 Tax=Hymenobacter lapidarius TaxID=1908237 RepID=A0A1G1TAY8_9BACT|nr:hypothetical protein [Hymenobacter lapidarius]OGX88036.1 hypothetical protein BEN47_09790 [Hymenobacter lapidarius]